MDESPFRQVYMIYVCLSSTLRDFLSWVYNSVLFKEGNDELQKLKFT